MELRKGDYGEAYTLTCRVDGVVKDLSSYTGVKFKMWKYGDPSTLKVNRTCSFISKPDGTVSYTPTVDDTNTAGRYIGELELTATGVVSSSDPFEVLVTDSG